MLSTKLLRHVAKYRGQTTMTSDSTLNTWMATLHQLDISSTNKKTVTGTSISSTSHMSSMNLQRQHQSLHFESLKSLLATATHCEKFSRQYHTLLAQPQQRSTVKYNVQVRCKSKKKVYDSDNDSDEDDALDEDDFDAPSNFKTMKIHTGSLRADAIVSSALNISRNRLDEIFLSSGLLVNGKIMTKKSEKMDEGDYVDVVSDKTDGQLKVRRIKVIKVYPERTGTDKFILKIRAWKSPFFIDAPDRR